MQSRHRTMKDHKEKYPQNWVHGNKNKNRIVQQIDEQRKKTEKNKNETLKNKQIKNHAHSSYSN